MTCHETFLAGSQTLEHPGGHSHPVLQGELSFFLTALVLFCLHLEGNTGNRCRASAGTEAAGVLEKAVRP